LEKTEAKSSSLRIARALTIIGGILLIIGFFATLAVLIVRLVLGVFVVLEAVIAAAVAASISSFCSGEPQEPETSFTRPMLLAMISSFVLGGMVSPIIFLIASVFLFAYQENLTSHRKGLIIIGFIALIFGAFGLYWIFQTNYLEFFLNEFFFALTGFPFPFHILVVLLAAIPVIGAIFSIIAGIVIFTSK
jgi:hypothetical protein